MAINLNTVPPESKRYSASVDFTITAVGAGEEAISYRFLWRSTDKAIEVQINVVSGSFALRLDSDPSNLATFTTATTDVVRTVVTPSPGVHTMKIVSLGAAQLSLIEIYVV